MIVNQTPSGEVMEDMFRPTTEPARTIYDAFLCESKKRKGRTPDQWRTCELNAVGQAVSKWARNNGYVPPTLEDVQRASDHAAGHVDYGSKWALEVADSLALIDSTEGRDA